MLKRHILVPVLITLAIGVPALVFESDFFESKEDSSAGSQMTPGLSGISTGYQTSSAAVSLAPQQFSGNTAYGQSFQTGYPAGTVASPTQAPIYVAGSPIQQPGASPMMLPSGAARGIPANGASFSVPPGTPQTIILPGDANGPYLNAAPMEFVPTSNLAEIFRFDVYPNWVRNRWKRVSSAATDYGLHGLRVPLVTGVNPNDLHGSLTYYFDTNQTVQRITFRGWTGDATRLVDLVTRSFQFKPQATHMSGLYIASNWRNTTGALFMQHPTVARAEATTQQVAVSLEINNPNGKFVLSHEMASALPRAKSKQ